MYLLKSSENPSGQMARVEADEHLALLGVADTLDGTDQPRSLRHKKLLMIVGVIVGGQHDDDRAAETAVDVVGHNTLQYCSLEDAIEPALIGVEVIGGHRVFLLGLLRCNAADTGWPLLCS